MMAIRVYPGTETPRLMSRTSKVREGEWDLVRGNHQGQRQLPRDQQAGHKTVPDQGMPKRQKALATQEPSTQDIIGRLAPSDQWALKDPRDKRVPWLVYQ